MPDHLDQLRTELQETGSCSVADLTIEEVLSELVDQLGLQAGECRIEGGRLHVVGPPPLLRPATRLAGEFRFGFGSRRRAERFRDQASLAPLASNGRTVSLGEWRVYRTRRWGYVAAVPFEYEAVSAGRHDLAGFAYQAICRWMRGRASGDRCWPNWNRVKVD